MGREQVLEEVDRAVRQARGFVDDVEFSAEDATRSDWDYLVQVFGVAVKAGATTLNVPDTVGYTTPVEYHELIRYLRAHVPGADDVIFSLHCHNDLGLAVANSLAAIQAGARQVECTVNGIGERAGNTAMEEVVMALKVRQGRVRRPRHAASAPPRSTRRAGCSRRSSACPCSPTRRSSATTPSPTRRASTRTAC